MCLYSSVYLTSYPATHVYICITYIHIYIPTQRIIISASYTLMIILRYNHSEICIDFKLGILNFQGSKWKFRRFAM